MSKYSNIYKLFSNNISPNEGLVKTKWKLKSSVSSLIMISALSSGISYASNSENFCTNDGALCAFITDQWVTGYTAKFDKNTSKISFSDDFELSAYSFWGGVVNGQVINNPDYGVETVGFTALNINGNPDADLENLIKNISEYQLGGGNNGGGNGHALDKDDFYASELGDKRYNDHYNVGSPIVNGWPNTLSFGTVPHEQSVSPSFYGSIKPTLDRAPVESIFRYTVLGTNFNLSDNGQVNFSLGPEEIAQQLIVNYASSTSPLKAERELAENLIEYTIAAENYLQHTSNSESEILEKRIMPVQVVYTAEFSGGRADFGDIFSKEKILENFVGLSALTGTYRYYAIIDDENENDNENWKKRDYPATLILNPDTAGEMQRYHKELLDGTDPDYNSLHEIELKHLGEAFKAWVEVYRKLSENEGNPYFPNDKFPLPNNFPKTSELDSIINSFKAENEIYNFESYVKAVNYIIDLIGQKSVVCGWQFNAWGAGTSHWLHDVYDNVDDYKAAYITETKEFMNDFMALDEDYSCDFIVFDKYERNAFGGEANDHVYNYRSWENYLGAIKYLSENVDFKDDGDIPVMLWQIPGGNFMAQDESENTKMSIASNDMNYFFGTNLDGNDKNHIEPSELFTQLPEEIRNWGDINYSRVEESKDAIVYLNEASYYEQEEPPYFRNNLDVLVDSNVFALLVGGGSTTGLYGPSSGVDDAGWLGDRISEYYNGDLLDISNNQQSYDLVEIIRSGNVDTALSDAQNAILSDSYQLRLKDNNGESIGSSIIVTEGNSLEITFEYSNLLGDAGNPVNYDLKLSINGVEQHDNLYLNEYYRIAPEYNDSHYLTYSFELEYTNAENGLETSTTTVNVENGQFVPTPGVCQAWDPNTVYAEAGYLVYMPADTSTIYRNEWWAGAGESPLDNTDDPYGNWRVVNFVCTELD